MQSLSPNDLVRRGCIQVMEGRHCFGHLSVEDNLMTGAFTRRDGKAAIARDLELVYEYFPRLKMRRSSQAGYTSGGEQQMTAIGRALMSKPKMILLDEPSMGLAPQLVEEIFDIVKKLNEEQGVSFLLAEQNTNTALRYAKYGYILESGRVVLDGEAAALRENEDVKEFYLGVGGEGRKIVQGRQALQAPQALVVVMITSRLQWLLLQLGRKLWVRASLFSVLAVGTAFVALLAKPYIPDDLETKIGADAVDNVLGIIASSMLAVTIFSLSTMVSAFTAATNNVSPRATKLLMQDSTSQNALATFIGSFLFSVVGIVVLSTGAYGDGGRVVVFVVTIGVIIVIVLTLLRWIDYLSRLGRVGQTTDLVENVDRQGDARPRRAALSRRPEACRGHVGPVRECRAGLRSPSSAMSSTSTPARCRNSPKRRRG